MKTLYIGAIALLAVLLISSGGGLLVTHAASPTWGNTGWQQSSQALSINLVGGVASLGNQYYSVEQKGAALVAIVDGSPLTSTQLTYVLSADQRGLSTSGTAYFQLTGQDPTGNPVSVTGNVQISGSVPALCLPSLSAGACATGDTSEVPLYFTGSASIQVPSMPTDNTPVLLESAYFDPFGNAINITAMDGSVFIVTDYTQGTISWSNAVDVGAVSGTLGTTPIAGAFQQVVSERENLVAGTSRDYGTISFSQMTNLTSGAAINYLNDNGVFLGSSTIPQAGSIPCGQTCAQTGFQDSGTFMTSNWQNGNSATIIGTYNTQWSVPAFSFSSVVNGQVTQESGSYN
jgi:hypothetical protein